MASILDDLKYTWRKPNPLLARLILINVFAFVILNLLTFLAPGDTYRTIYTLFAMPAQFFGVDTDHSLVYRPWTFFTSFFSHQGFMHIIGNMLGLYWFGMLIRDFMGDRKLLALYLLGGIAGSLSVLLLYNVILPLGGGEALNRTIIGASAAVFAIAAAAATKFPDYQFNLIFIGPVKIKYIVLVYVFLSFLGLRGGNQGGDFAHLAGALIGFLYVKQMERGVDLGKPVLAVVDYFQDFFKPKPKIKVSHRGGKRTASQKKTGASAKKKPKGSTKSEQDEIDAILDKISQSGYESLSKEEKQKLFNASNK